MVHERSEPPERASKFELLRDIIGELSEGDELGSWNVPATPEELHRRVCLAAEAQGADVETLYLETAAAPLELARWLRWIEKRSERLAGIGRGLLPELRGEQERAAHRCPLCRDTGYIVGAMRANYTTMRFCSCEIGLAAEAGTWARILYGQPWNKNKKPTPANKRALKAYCERLGRNEFDLRARIKAAEAQRRGKRQEETDGEGEG